MSDLALLLVLILGGIAALAIALLRARRKGAVEAKASLERKEARHAEEIANNVANARAARKSSDPPAGGTDGSVSVRVRPDPYKNRGWRD